MSAGYSFNEVRLALLLRYNWLLIQNLFRMQIKFVKSFIDQVPILEERIPLIVKPDYSFVSIFIINLNYKLNFPYIRYEIFSSFLLFIYDHLSISKRRFSLVNWRKCERQSRRSFVEWHSTLLPSTDLSLV